MFTNEAGEYTVTGVPFGAFGAFQADAVDTAGQTLASATGTVNAQDDTVVADIHLPQVGTITGTVTFAAGSPAPFTSVQLRLEGRPTRFASTGASGVYTFTQVPVGVAATVRALPSGRRRGVP